jgi:UDP-xylose/UDP-N-acetylglucosamine transporter B4
MTSSSSTARHRAANASKSKADKSNGSAHHNGAVKRSEHHSYVPQASKGSSVALIWAPTLVLIFGGCCSNVYTLESLIQTSPSSGPLITAFQFLLVALATLPKHFSLDGGWRNLYLKPRAIPLKKWLVYTAYFLSINILNNIAFNYRISIPLHIILRSAGPVTTMAVGRIWGGKRYPTQKIIAVALLFIGVVLAAISDASAKPPHAHRDDLNETSSDINSTGISNQAPGFALLASALVLSACMGLYTDDMYSTHGRSGAITAETLFYSHSLSLPFFAAQVRPLIDEFSTIVAISTRDPLSIKSEPSPLTRYLPISPMSPINYFTVPLPVVLLLLNALTQLLCIVGVNRLSAQSSSLTVSIVLNIRKLASLLLSIWLFGNQLPSGVIVGAAVVFVGGGLYALPASGRPKSPSTGALEMRPDRTDKKTR